MEHVLTWLWAAAGRDTHWQAAAAALRKHCTWAFFRKPLTRLLLAHSKSERIVKQITSYAPRVAMPLTAKLARAARG